MILGPLRQETKESVRNCFNRMLPACQEKSDVLTPFRETDQIDKGITFSMFKQTFNAFNMNQHSLLGSQEHLEVFSCKR